MPSHVLKTPHDAIENDHTTANIIVNPQFQGPYRLLTLEFRRLGYDIIHLKFTPGCSSFGNLLLELSSATSISQKGVELLNNLADKLRKEDPKIKQATLGKKLSEFVEQYRNTVTSPKQIIFKTSTDVANKLANIQDMMIRARGSREWNYTFRQDVLGYMLTVSINSKETPGKTEDRRKLLGKFSSQSILPQEDINFLDNYSTFNSFCALLIK